MSHELSLNAANFKKEVLESKMPVLVDFWAPWCMPCKMIGPLVAEMAQEFAGSVVVGKVNVDEEGDLAAQYNIISIPCLIMFKDGKVAAQRAGALPKHELQAFIKNNM